MTAILHDVIREAVEAASDLLVDIDGITDRVEDAVSTWLKDSLGTVEPGARDSDPATSVTAADLVRGRATSHRVTLLHAYGQHPAGLTDDEAGDAAGLAHTGYWKRCSELRQAGVIAASTHTRPGKSGFDQMVCAITPLGRAVIHDREAAL